MFKEAYTAAVRFYKAGPWYHNADIWSGLPTQQQTTSLQAFWPGAPRVLPCLGPCSALEKRTGKTSASSAAEQQTMLLLGTCSAVDAAYCLGWQMGKLLHGV